MGGAGNTTLLKSDEALPPSLRVNGSQGAKLPCCLHLAVMKWHPPLFPARAVSEKAN